METANDKFYPVDGIAVWYDDYGMRMQCHISFRTEPGIDWIKALLNKIDTNPTETIIRPKSVTLFRDKFRPFFNQMIKSSIDFVNGVYHE